MAKLSQTYEAVIVLSTKAGEENLKAVIAKINDLISNNATEVVVDEWGKRRLAYAINYETDGFYVMITFTSNPDFPAELDRVLKITDGVLRALVTVKNV